MLQSEPPEGCTAAPEPTTGTPEWLLLLRAGVGRERLAIIVAVVAVSVAAVVILAVT